MNYLVAVDRFFPDMQGGSARVAWDIAREMRDKPHHSAPANALAAATLRAREADKVPIAPDRATSVAPPAPSHCLKQQA